MLAKRREDSAVILSVVIAQILNERINIKHLQAKDKDTEMIWGWEGHES